MLRPIIGETIEVRLNLAPGPCQVFADPVEMDQVVMNLLLNARDAMPAGGIITIETVEGMLDEAAASALEMAAGPCATLRVADTGQGIDAAVMPHLFDPFFTTKPIGKGAGLGLSTVRQIVRRRGGAVWASSDPGAGSIFHVCLPRVHDRVRDRRYQARSPRLPERGAETVLVVEDEESVRRLLTSSTAHARLPGAGGRRWRTGSCPVSRERGRDSTRAYRRDHAQNGRPRVGRPSPCSTPGPASGVHVRLPRCAVLRYRSPARPSAVSYASR